MARNDLEGLHQEEVERPVAVVDRSNEGDFLLSVSDDEADVIELRDVNWSTDNHEDGIRHREAPLEARRFKSSDSELGGIFNGMDLHDLLSNDVGLISDDEFKQELSDVSDALHPKKLAYVNDDTHGPLGENLDKSTVHPLVIKFLRTVGYILVWYILSTCLTVYNKELLGKTLGKFPAPLLMNTVHFTLQAITSKVMLRYWCAPMRPTVKLSWRDYFLRVVPTATATALDVNLSNESFVFISVTFATMCKSAAPVFLLLFAFAFRLESPNLKLLGIIVIISSGVLLTAAKETEFDVVGFVLVMLATVMAGFRWTVTQLLLQKEEYGLNNPLAVLSNLTPVMAVLTFVCSIILEPWHMLGVSSYFNSTSHALQSCALMLLGGLLAFCMVMAEFTVISETSAVTLTVAGVVKEVVTIVVAFFFFHDSFTVVKGIGLVVIIVGVCLFNWFKYQKLVHGQNGPLHRSADPAVGNKSVRYTALQDIIDDASDPGAHL